MKHAYTEEQLTQAISSSFSIRQVLCQLGLVPAGGNYSTIKRQIDSLQLDTSHFTGQLWSKGKTVGPKRPIEDYLSNEFPIGSNRLKCRLISEGYLEHKCYDCGNTTWKGMPIPIELEHVDGNHDNNSLDNLTILCPNCHAFTVTYRGRKLKRIPTKPKRITVMKEDNHCVDCGVIISQSSQRCRPCAGKHHNATKIQWPSKKELLQRVSQSSYTQVAKELGVSDNAIRKHILKN